MNFQLSQFALFVCFTGLIAFLAYSVSIVRRSGITSYLKGLVFAAKTIIGGLINLIMSFLGLLATATVASEEDDAEEGDLTGVYNFRTRKYDNGTDPYGWYEEDR